MRAGYVVQIAIVPGPSRIRGVAIPTDRVDFFGPPQLLLGKEQQFFELKALYSGYAAVVSLDGHLIAPQVRVDAKKYLLGLAPLWDVVLFDFLGRRRG
jgi:hypothetical protein